MLLWCWHRTSIKAKRPLPQMHADKTVQTGLLTCVATLSCHHIQSYSTSVTSPPLPSSNLMHVCMWHFSPPFHFSPTSSPFLPSLITISSPHFNPAPYTPPFFSSSTQLYLPPLSSSCLFLPFLFSSLPCLHPILFCLKRILVRMNWLETQRWKMLAFVLTFLRI